MYRCIHIYIKKFSVKSPANAFICVNIHREGKRERERERERERKREKERERESERARERERGREREMMRYVI